MEKRPDAILLKFPGTNCDLETARAMDAAGFATRTVPIARAHPAVLDGARVAVLAGGFSYGDYVMAGRIAELENGRRLGDALHRFRDAGGYLFGICNGFQIFSRLGLLPAGSLIDNTSGRFQCRWVTLENRRPDSPFLQGLPAEFELPVAHAEGRFVTKSDAEAQAYLDSGLAALTYLDDVNGSALRIAGLTDDTGRVFGLMPHPERFLFARHHYDPDWHGAGADDGYGTGFAMFRSLYQAVTG
ncbi:phosphoribosylformylglycinamidine synthase subunit PurQ [soil metagenome]